MMQPAASPEGAELHYDPMLAGSGAFSHFSEILLEFAGGLRLGDDLVDLGEQLRLFLVQADVAGAVLDHELDDRRRAPALFSAMAAAMTLPVAIRSTWPEMKAEIVALLSS